MSHPEKVYFIVCYINLSVELSLAILHHMILHFYMKIFYQAVVNVLWDVLLSMPIENRD